MIQSPLTTRPDVVHVDPASLHPNPSNARKHSDKQIQQIAASLQRFGFLVPIVVDASHMIRAGHGRWLAARHMCLASVPIIEARFMSDEDARAFALAENRIAELSDWDQDLLAGELKDLFELDYDFNVTGFELSDLDFGELDTPKSCKAERVELPPSGADAVSRAGDLWFIGPHKLLCGDAMRFECYEQLLGAERARLIVTDPPYNVPIGGNVSGLGQVQHREFVMASGEMSLVEFTAFLRGVFRNCVHFSTAGSIHYCFMDWRHIREILDAADGVYARFMQLITWVKDNAGMGAFYRSQHELIFVFKSGRGKHINNFGLGEKGRYRTNVFSYPGVNTFGKGRDRDLEDHPTVKNSDMIADMLLDCSNKGDLVLDPFCGSGTLLLAAHRTGRRGAAIEIDPLYVDVALRRLQEASGLEPKLADGTTFAEAKAQRSVCRETGDE